MTSSSHIIASLSSVPHTSLILQAAANVKKLPVSQKWPSQQSPVTTVLLSRGCPGNDSCWPALQLAGLKVQASAEIIVQVPTASIALLLHSLTPLPEFLRKTSWSPFVGGDVAAVIMYTCQCHCHADDVQPTGSETKIEAAEYSWRTASCICLAALVARLFFSRLPSASLSAGLHSVS